MITQLFYHFSLIYTLGALITVHTHKGIYLSNRFIDFAQIWKGCSQDMCIPYSNSFYCITFHTYLKKTVQQSVKFQNGHD